MDCQRVRIELAEYAAGQCTTARGEVLEAHIAVCLACERALAEERLLQQLAEESLGFSGRAYPFAALRARMHQRAPLERVLVILPKLRRIGATPRFAVALVLLVCFGGVAYAARYSRDLYVACKNPILAQREFINEEFPEIYDAVYADPKDVNLG